MHFCTTFYSCRKIKYNSVIESLEKRYQFSISKTNKSSIHFIKKSMVLQNEISLLFHLKYFAEQCDFSSDAEIFSSRKQAS